VRAALSANERDIARKIILFARFLAKFSAQRISADKMRVSATSPILILPR